MTAPATLPAEVQAIVRALAAGPDILDGVPQAWINAAFDHGVVEVVGSAMVGGVHPWRTKYALRDQTPRPTHGFRLDIS